jgi:hypothetical protein
MTSLILRVGSRRIAGEECHESRIHGLLWPELRHIALGTGI